MICYNCGTKLTGDGTTCPACGKKQAIPQSLLDDVKKGDRNSIIGLYNYSYASVYETVKAYLSEDDEIQNMIRKIYLETFHRISAISDAEQFRPLLHKVALEYLANRTPVEKEASPAWLIIPDTDTLRQILDGLEDYMQEQAHKAAEMELMKRYNLEATDNRIVKSESATGAQNSETSEIQSESDQIVAGNTAGSIPTGTHVGGSAENVVSFGKNQNFDHNKANGMEQASGSTQEEDSFWEGFSDKLYNRENQKNQNSNDAADEEESLEKALRQVASSASEDWASLGFSQTQGDEEEEPMEPSRVPLILGIVLAVAAVVVVVILLIGAFGNRTGSDTKKQNTTTSESQSQADVASDSQMDSEIESQSDSDTDSEAQASEGLADGSEDLTETEQVTETEQMTETEGTELEADATGNLLMSDDIPLDESDAVVLGNEDLQRSEVGTVTFLSTLADAPEDAWDVSANGDGLVMAWAVMDESTELYDLYVAGEGGIYANEDSAYFFAFYDSATSITFNGCFHTQNVTDMSGMFYECASLENLDLSGFDTSAVTNMSFMFYDCVSLTDLDFSSFDTSKVTAMSYMFTSCESLAELSLSRFDFANVTDMEYMFAGCSSLETVDIDLTNAADEINTEGMYEGTSIE